MQDTHKNNMYSNYELKMKALSGRLIYNLRTYFRRLYYINMKYMWFIVLFIDCVKSSLATRGERVGLTHQKDRSVFNQKSIPKITHQHLGNCIDFLFS